MVDAQIFLLVLPTVAGVAIASLVFGLYRLSQPDPVETRMSSFGRPSYNLEQYELTQPFADRVMRPILRGLAMVALSRTPQATLDNIRQNLTIAGNPGNLDVRDFLGIKGLGAIGLAGLVLLCLAGAAEPIEVAGATALAGLIGYLAPNMWLSGKIKARKKEIVRAMPDALDLLTICVEAGLGFDAAMLRVTEKWQNALSQEFSRALSEVRMGVSRRDALRSIVTRTDVPDVATFISAVVQADQLGVSIARVLHTQAEQMRTRRRLRAEELAHKAPVKMVFPMIFLIFPAMYVILLGPAIPALIDGLGVH